MVRDAEIERVAIREAIAHEEALGWVVESVETENRGYDLLSKKPHPSEPGVFVSARFIEVKGRAGVGEVALSSNEYRTAQRLGDDYWLYAVFDCGAEPKLNAVQNPAKLEWQPIVRVEHYHVGAKAILEAARWVTRCNIPSASSRSTFPSNAFRLMRAVRNRSDTGTFQHCISGGLAGL